MPSRVNIDQEKIRAYLCDASRREICISLEAQESRRDILRLDQACSNSRGWKAHINEQGDTIEFEKKISGKTYRLARTSFGIDEATYALTVTHQSQEPPLLLTDSLIAEARFRYVHDAVFKGEDFSSALSLKDVASLKGHTVPRQDLIRNSLQVFAGGGILDLDASDKIAICLAEEEPHKIHFYALDAACDKRGWTLDLDSTPGLATLSIKDNGNIFTLTRQDMGADSYLYGLTVVSLRGSSEEPIVILNDSVAAQARFLYVHHNHCGGREREHDEE